jgi:hypothetical protein
VGVSGEEIELETHSLSHAFPLSASHSRSNSQTAGESMEQNGRWGHHESELEWEWDGVLEWVFRVKK